MTPTHLSCSSWLTVALLSATAACATDATNDSAALRSREPAALLVASGDIQLGGSATLETIAASRGLLALDVTPLGSQITAPGVVTTVRGSFVEKVEHFSDSIEQSWSFERVPGQEGDLTIVIGVTGLDYVDTTASGIRLRRAGEFGVSYSHGFWVEANGTRWPIPASYERDRILLTVPASLVSRSGYPAVLDPQIIVTPG